MDVTQKVYDKTKHLSGLFQNKWLDSEFSPGEGCILCLFIKQPNCLYTQARGVFFKPGANSNCVF